MGPANPGAGQWLAVPFLLVGSLLAQPLQAAGLSTISIQPTGAHGAAPFPGWELRAPFAALNTLELELGDQPYAAVLGLLPAAAAADHRVSVQFETSMAISDEGPQFDLLDWKHCRSDWITLVPGAGATFVLPAPSDAQASCFPAVTVAEIRSALAARLRADSREGPDAERWLSLLRPLASVDELPISVGISTMRLRIEVRDNDAWRQLTMLELKLPLGC